MGNISLSFTNNTHKKKINSFQQSKEKIYLNFYPEIKGQEEKFTYINEEGNEVEFNDPSYVVYKTSQTKGEAKKVTIDKIPLNFIEGKEEVKYQPAYFSYNGKEVFIDKPEFNEETNSYFGIVKVNNIIDKEIQIFEY